MLVERWCGAVVTRVADAADHDPRQAEPLRDVGDRRTLHLHEVRVGSRCDCIACRHVVDEPVARCDATGADLEAAGRTDAAGGDGARQGQGRDRALRQSGAGAGNRQGYPIWVPDVPARVPGWCSPADRCRHLTRARFGRRGWRTCVPMVPSDRAKRPRGGAVGQRGAARPSPAVRARAGCCRSPRTGTRG